MFKTRSGSWKQHVRGEWESGLALLRPRLNLLAGLAGRLPSFAFTMTRLQLYRLAGIRVGVGSVLMGPLHLIGPDNVTGRLELGAESFFAPHIVFGLDDTIRIGDRVSVGPHATFYTATHAIGFGSRRMSPPIVCKPIVVEDGAWIGMYSLILPGVTIGRGAVVSAGAVVTQDVPPNALVAGNPATVQQTLPFGNR